MPGARFATFLPILAAAAACSGSDAERALAPAQRDSAYVDEHGQRAVVHIVASAAPAWRGDEGWHVDRTPRLVLDGRTGGGPPFGRVTAAARFDDGAVVVADAASSGLRLFDPVGRPLHTIGEATAGDGGLPGIGGVVLRGDTLLALDAPATVVRFHRDGTFIDASGTPLLDRFGETHAGEYVRLLADGSLLAWLYERLRAERAEGPFRPDRGFLRLHPGDAREDTIGWYPGREHVQVGGDARWAAFAADSDATADDRYIYIGDSGAGTIDVHDYDGRLLRRIQLAVPATRVTAADLAAYRDAFRARVLARSGPAAVSAYEAMLSALPAADRLPAFRRLLTDSEGHLWVEAYPWPAGSAPRWSVFDADGHWLGDVATPSGLTPLEIGRGYLLGVRSEPGDGDRVELYAVRKPSGARPPLPAGGVAGR